MCLQLFTKEKMEIRKHLVLGEGEGEGRSLIKDWVPSYRILHDSQGVYLMNLEVWP